MIMCQSTFATVNLCLFACFGSNCLRGGGGGQRGRGVLFIFVAALIVADVVLFPEIRRKDAQTGMQTNQQ